jgi:polar amino acid transport system substrate-binding protein
MTAGKSLIIVLMVTCLLLAAGCTRSLQEGPGQGLTAVQTASSPEAATPQTMITPDDLTARVQEAVAYARENGRDRAVAAFSDPAGGFAMNGIYIFAKDYNGTALAEPFEPQLVGTDVRNTTDRYGVPVILKFEETARYGIGYVSYDYPDQKTMVAMPRLSVVADVDGSWYIGADTKTELRMVYPSSVLGPASRTYTVTDLTTFVKDAVAYAREHGKDKALAVFQEKNGRFADGELTIIAVDYNGTMTASSLSPKIADNRINLINYHDPDGVTTIREMRDLARQGGGFSYTVAAVTREGKTYYAPKIDYAEPVDDTYWVFSGIIVPGYEILREGNLTGMVVRHHTREELYGLVNRAVAFAKANGKEKTLAMINDPGSPFVEDDLFVWAEDFNGTVLADPYWKEGIGRNYIDETDLYGAKITRVSINAIRSGTGCTHVMFPDTSGNSTVPVPKLVYMQPVDETWWIGSGVYGVQAT